MKMPDFKKLNGFVNIGKTFIAARRPEILLGMSLTSTVGAVIMAAKGGYKARGIIDAAELEKEDFPLNVKEKIQLTWLCYLPAAGLTAGALGSTTALHVVHVKTNRALATAFLSATDEIKRSIVTTTEEETDKILQGRADENGVARIENSDGVIEELYLVRDDKSGRDIWSNASRIEEAVNNVNKWIAKNGDCELNTFYSAAGFEQLPDGDDWGWSGDFCEISWDLVQKDDGRPVRRFKFRSQPKEGYSKSHS